MEQFDFNDLIGNQFAVNKTGFLISSLNNQLDQFTTMVTASKELDESQHIFKIEIQREGKHFAKVLYNDKFCCWLSKPESDKRRKTSKQFIHKFGLPEYCEICIDNSWANLEVHHKTEVSDGGQDVKENLMTVCNSCHTIIHTLRSYRKRLIK